jgi:hypothetical protein
MSLYRLTAVAALSLALGALASPGVYAQQDLRNPDTRDATEPSHGSLNPQTGTPAAGPQPSDSGGYQDLRNPDNRDAAEASYTDLRNPDNRDVADSGGAFPEVTLVEVPVASPSADSGLDWGDAGIGAGGMLGLTLLAAGGALAIAHRRETSRRTATTS